MDITKNASGDQPSHLHQGNDLILPIHWRINDDSIALVFGRGFVQIRIDKQTGKILSTNDYTNTEKAKLAAISGSNTGDQDLSSYATNANLNLKINIADTSAMLSNRINRDTTALSNRINLKLDISDTALMLSNRIHRDTSSLSNRINLKANSSDIITDLALKANTTDVSRQC